MVTKMVGGYFTTGEVESKKGKRSFLFSTIIFMFFLFSCYG